MKILLSRVIIFYGLFSAVNSAFAQAWTQATTPSGAGGWWSVASSADGTKLVSVVYNGSIYVSTNSGAAWTNTTAPNLSWTGVASSADGTKLVAVVANFPGIYTSTNSGMTWISNNAPNLDWFSVASSADGGNLVAESGGGIYFSQSVFTPQLNIASANTNLMLSWIIPSTNFVVQQSSDLTSANWTDLTNMPTLNLTNLQNEVMLCPSNSSAFFRLMAQIGDF